MSKEYVIRNNAIDRCHGALLPEDGASSSGQLSSTLHCAVKVRGSYKDLVNFKLSRRKLRKRLKEQGWPVREIEQVLRKLDGPGKNGEGESTRARSREMLLLLQCLGFRV